MCSGSPCPDLRYDQRTEATIVLQSNTTRWQRWIVAVLCSFVNYFEPFLLQLWDNGRLGTNGLVPRVVGKNVKASDVLSMDGSWSEPKVRRGVSDARRDEEDELPEWGELKDTTRKRAKRDTSKMQSSNKARYKCKEDEQFKISAVSLLTRLNGLQ